MQSPESKEYLVAVIGDEDTVAGFLLAGVGERDIQTQTSNFFVVNRDTGTTTGDIEEAFVKLTHRSDIGMVLINQSIANEIRHVINSYDQMIPTVLEIPSKDHPYDPDQDRVMLRVKQLLGVE